MYTQWKRYTLGSLALALIVFANGCGGETTKAIKLIDEGNAANQEGNQFAISGSNKLKEVGGKMDGFPNNRAEIKGPAKDAADLFQKSIARLRDAASKYDEASKLNVDAKFKEYLTLQTKAIRKEIEKLEALTEMPKQLLDESKDADTVNKKLTEIGERVTKLNQEQKDFEAQANKVRTDNLSIFKS